MRLTSPVHSVMPRYIWVHPPGQYRASPTSKSAPNPKSGFWEGLVGAVKTTAIAATAVGAGFVAAIVVAEATKRAVPNQRK